LPLKLGKPAAAPAAAADTWADEEDAAALLAWVVARATWAAPLFVAATALAVAEFAELTAVVALSAAAFL